MGIDTKSALVGAAGTAAILLLTYGIYSQIGGKPAPQAPSLQLKAARELSNGDLAKPAVGPGNLTAQSVELSAEEFKKFRIEPAQEYDFRIQREAVGSIDFNREFAVDVFAPFPGKVIALFAKAGDDVQKGAILYTIDSPDLVQAESTLVSAAGTLQLTTRALARAKQLYEIQGVSQKDLEQATYEQQAAEGSLKAARDALRIFGKSDAEMDRIVAARRIDSVLAVHSPIAGRVTARNAAPGLFVQPGNGTAPYTVANVASMWMLASVPETEFPLLALGQDLDVAVAAYPGRVFRGRIVNIGAVVDPNTRRVQVRSEIRDPKHELRPGMFATFVIRTGKSARAVGVPFAGVVREGDGTMTVWVTTDGKRLVKRTVKVGLQQDGLHQILEGLKPGERVATDGALFLNNALTAASR